MQIFTEIFENIGETWLKFETPMYTYLSRGYYNIRQQTPVNIKIFECKILTY